MNEFFCYEFHSLIMLFCRMFTADPWWSRWTLECPEMDVRWKNSRIWSM